MGRLDKEAIRRFVIKHKIYQIKSTSRVIVLVEERFKVTLSARIIRHWVQRFKCGNWDFRDKSTRPHTIHYKMNPELEEWIVDYKKRTGFDSIAIQNILTRKRTQISVSTVKRVIRKYSLQEHTRMKGERIKWVRWERSTPNDLWQLDWTEEEDGTLRLPVIDDCSRYCLGVRHWKNITTQKVTRFLDELILFFGKPKQILSDNHAVVGGTGDTKNAFDIWCKRRGIEHIRTGINKPTTTGKTEKIHDTYNRAINRWKNPEAWRYSYNCCRPHQSLHGKTPAEVYNEWHRYLYFKRKWTKNLTKKSGNMS